MKSIKGRLKIGGIIIALTAWALFCCYCIKAFDGTVPEETLDTVKKCEERRREETGEERPSETYEVTIIQACRIEETLMYECPYVSEAPENAEPAKAITYSDDDLYCLAAVIYAEAGADYLSDELRMAVGNVVLNRVASDYYPDSIRKVIEQPKQYGWLSRDGIAFPEDAPENAVNRAYDCAKRLLEGERPLSENVLFQAEFIQGDGVYKIIDRVYFCYRKDEAK